MSPYEEIIESFKDKYFLSPDGKNLNRLLEQIGLAAESAVNGQGNGPNYRSSSPKSPLYQIAFGSEIPAVHSADINLLLSGLPAKLQGAAKAHDPFMAKNIIPLPTFAYLATFVATSLFMPNGVTGEDAATVLDSEIACASALAKLAGYDFNRSAGIFTFGGTGTNLYALKIGLMKAMPEHGATGLNGGNVVVIGSRSSHYCHQTSSNWLGIGQSNYLQAATNLDQTTNLVDMEILCRKSLEAGKYIAGIEALGGTTSNMAIDDIEAICQMRDMLVSEYGLNYKPHVHVDSVIGWAYLNFSNYDFGLNKLGFSPRVLEKAKKVTEAIMKIRFADSFGVDFHKTGYTPYVSSMIIVKDQDDFALLRRDAKIMTPLFHDDSVYNPGIFTLETSRSAANMLATWITLQTLGQDGFQALLGHSLEMSDLMRKELGAFENIGLYVANRDSYGCDIFVRCYPPGTVPSSEFPKELNDDSLLKANTRYTDHFAKWLFQSKASVEEGIVLSKSSAAFYTHTGSPMVALRIYSLNPNMNSSYAKTLISRLAAAKKEFDEL